MTVVYPPGEITPLGDQMLQNGNVSELSYKGWNGNVFHLQGGQAPMLGLQDGFGLQELSGLQADFVLLDNQGARQDGTTNLDSLYDPCMIRMTLEASGISAMEFRRVVRTWISSWRPDQVGILSWFSQQLGEWWMPVRQAKTFRNALKASPTLHRRQTFDWYARGDNAFWQGIDSVSQFTLSVGSTASTGFNPVTNMGTQSPFPRHLVYGPGTFSIGDGAPLLTPGSKNVSMITFGPLLEGQIALITTQPRLRSIVDLTPTQPKQSLTQLQNIVEALVNYATANDVPPLLQSFESTYGILPPQGPMYSLLNGRFMNPISPKVDGVAPVTSFIPVGISGGNSASKIVTAITPFRTYPE